MASQKGAAVQRRTNGALLFTLLFTLIVALAVLMPVAEPVAAQAVRTPTPSPTARATAQSGGSTRPLCENVRPANRSENCGALPGAAADPGSGGIPANGVVGWRDQLQTGLEEFDLLHAEYVASPGVSKTADWTRRFKAVYLRIYRASYLSGRDTVVYYARCLEDEYLRGVIYGSPLLVSYGLQAREMLGQYAAGVVNPAQATAVPDAA
jgi:hypothetical protein